MKLYDIPRHSKIMCELSDGSSFLMFDHLDGMYSFCMSENGNVVHLAGRTELEKQEDGSYKLCHVEPLYE
jgi:hypothetical protein